MDFKIVRRVDSVMLLAKKGSTKFIGSFQVAVFGDKGIVTDLCSEKFYDLMLKYGARVMKALKIKRLEGYVIPGHERLMRIKLRTIATVTVLHDGEVDGIPMLWIVIRPKAVVE